MTERILIRRQGLGRIKMQRRDKNTGQQFRYGGDGEEWEDVDEISFRLGARVDRDTVDPPPPQPRMAVAMIDVSPEARSLEERSSVAGYTVFIVSASLGGWGATHMIFHAHPNQGGGVLCRWRSRKRRQKGKLM